jgi:aryl-alcohol dehydrogenase-like predicted oxidoreductase
MELALGTVQFGLPYGIAGRGEPVPEAEVRRILQIAHAGGISLLDTAAAYGTIEERLPALCGGLQFRIVSKIPALPGGADLAVVEKFVADAVRSASQRLGGSLSAMLFHRAEDLLGPGADSAWRAALDAARPHQVQIGVSVYGPAEARAVQKRFAIEVVQVPANAFDQRLREAGSLNGVATHLRSVLLQGLLLMPASEAAARVPAAAEPLARWRRWCDERGLETLQAALALVKGMGGASHAVIGVDSAAQLETILDAWQSSAPLTAPELACSNPDVIDPRRWNAV